MKFMDGQQNDKVVPMSGEDMAKAGEMLAKLEAEHQKNRPRPFQKKYPAPSRAEIEKLEELIYC